MLHAHVTCRKQKPKRAARISGISRDAEKLGVTREHLQRVLVGLRVSKSLMQRYCELHPQFKLSMNQAPYSQALHESQRSPADDFLAASWVHGVLSKLRMGAVVVELESEADRSIQFAEQIGNHLQIGGLGQFDSTKWFPVVRHFFVIRPGRLGAALEFIKGALKQRGMLDQVKIGYYEPKEKLWRTFHPSVLTEANSEPTAEE